jgi:hypothetical protein
MTIVQCNWCMTKYEEDADHLVFTCSSCNTDSFLMELP